MLESSLAERTLILEQQFKNISDPSMLANVLINFCSEEKYKNRESLYLILNYYMQEQDFPFK